MNNYLDPEVRKKKETDFKELWSKPSQLTLLQLLNFPDQLSDQLKKQNSETFAL